MKIKLRLILAILLGRSVAYRMTVRGDLTPTGKFEIAECVICPAMCQCGQMLQCPNWKNLGWHSGQPDGWLQRFAWREPDHEHMYEWVEHDNQWYAWVCVACGELDPVQGRPRG